MPRVGEKKFPYTPEGMLAARKARKIGGDAPTDKKAKKMVGNAPTDTMLLKNERLKNPFIQPKPLNLAAPPTDRKTLKQSTNRDAVTKSNPIKGY